MEQQIPFLSSSNWKGETNPTNKTPTKIQPKSAENVTTFRLPVLWLINLIFCSSKAINSCRFCLGKKHFPKKTQVKMWWNPSKVRLGRCHVLTSTRIRGPTVRLEDENCHGKNRTTFLQSFATSSPNMRALSSSSSASGGKMVTNGWVHTSHTTVEVDIPGTHPLGWYQIDIIWSQRVQASKDPARFSKRISTGYPDVCLCPSMDSGCKGPLKKAKWSPNFHKPRGRIRTWKWQEHIGSPLAQAVVTSRPRYQSFRVPNSEHGGSYDIKIHVFCFSQILHLLP